MDGIDLLRAQALARRNSAIARAKREYHEALKAIKVLERKLRIKPPGRPCKNQANDLSGLKAATVAIEILREGKAMSIAELTIEVQKRGCRVLDDPRLVAHSIEGGLHYHRRRTGEFERDAAGRWVAVNQCGDYPGS
jgi:hypothetical protein